MMAFMKRLFFVGSFILSIFISSSAYATTDLVVVVHNSNPITTLSKTDVIGLFMGKDSAFSTGERAIIIDLVDSHESRSIFYQQLVGRSIASVNAYWSRILFSGKRRAPIQKNNHQDIVNLMEGNRQAISYLPRSLVTNKMKVVFEFDQ